MMKTAKLNLERLEARDVPSVSPVAGASAVFSNGVLTVHGDNYGGVLTTRANTVYGVPGTLQVIDRGYLVPIQGGNPTLANTKQIVEVGAAQTLRPVTLAIDKTIGTIPTVLIGNGILDSFAPANTGPCVAFGSQNPNSTETFTSNPKGGDVFVGGAGDSRFVWPPGTGTDSYIGGRGHNTVTIIGGATDVDTLAVSAKDYIFARLNNTPFVVFATDIDTFTITAGNVTVSSY